MFKVKVKNRQKNTTKKNTYASTLLKNQLQLTKYLYFPQLVLIIKTSVICWLIHGCLVVPVFTRAWRFYRAAVVNVSWKWCNNRIRWQVLVRFGTLKKSRKPEHDRKRNPIGVSPSISVYQLVEFYVNQDFAVLLVDFQTNHRICFWVVVGVPKRVEESTTWTVICSQVGGELLAFKARLDLGWKRRFGPLLQVIPKH